MPLVSISRASIHYAGHVQGVGFRYAVLQTAKGYEVTGYVENLDDGRVLLVAEGDAGEVDGFVSAISERMGGYIRKAERVDVRAARQHQDFSMR